VGDLLAKGIAKGGEEDEVMPKGRGCGWNADDGRTDTWGGNHHPTLVDSGGRRNASLNGGAST